MCGCWFQRLVWTALPLDRPKFRACFTLSRRKIRSFLPSGGLLVEFWWCLKRRDPQMCTFGLSGCRVKPQRLRGRMGFTRQPENSKRAHLSAPTLQTPPKFHEKTPEREEKNEFCGGRGKKKREILGLPPFGPPPFGPHPSGPHWIWAPGLLKKTNQLKITKKQLTPKIQTINTKNPNN